LGNFSITNFDISLVIMPRERIRAGAGELRNIVAIHLNHHRDEV